MKKSLKKDYAKQDNSRPQIEPVKQSWWIILSKGLILILAVVFGFLVLCGGVKAVVNNIESTECQKWQAQSEQYPNFYLSGWQSEQCEARGFDFLK